MLRSCTACAAVVTWTLFGPPDVPSQIGSSGVTMSALLPVKPAWVFQ
jgi:hypothetical protein